METILREKNLVYVALLCITKIHIGNNQIIQQWAKILRIMFPSLFPNDNLLRLEETITNHVDQLQLPWFYIYFFR